MRTTISGNSSGERWEAQRLLHGRAVRLHVDVHQQLGEHSEHSRGLAQAHLVCEDNERYVCSTPR